LVGTSYSVISRRS